MKVLYDISKLGEDHVFSGFKGGIFRSIEDLAHHLVDSGQCDLTFTSINYLQETRNYLNSTQHFDKIAFPDKRASFREKITNVNKRLDRTPGKVSKNIAFKSLRKAAFLAEGAFGLSRFPIDPRVLGEADVFHSPFFALPDQVKNASHLKRFLTVNDLTPILLPQFFPSLDQSYFKFFDNILKSLGGEDWNICISQNTKDDLCDYLKCDPSKSIVIYLAADKKRFYHCNDPKKKRQVKETYKIPDAPYILSLSTLEPRKNIDHVIRSFVKLVREQHIVDLCLVLAGSKGWNYEKIFQEISHLDEYNLRNRIIITGHIEDEDLAALYSGSLAFVYLSFYEGFGLPPLEAMQCGSPVITSNTSSLPEVVGNAGIMLDPKDTDQFCQSIMDIYRSPSLQEEMSAKSLQRAKQFSWENCAAETLSAYRTALDN